MHFDLTDLRLFVQIAEASSLTKGARRVFLSAPAASGRIKALEEQLGAQLLYRDNRGVTLTGAGENLLRHARVILRQIEHLKDEFGARGAGSSGHIRIFANTTAVTEFMPELLTRFLSQHPGVTVDMQERLTRDIVRAVVDGSTDLGIVSGIIPMAGLEAKRFSTDRLILVTPDGHPLAKRRKTAFPATLSYEHISLHEGSTLHAFIRDLTDRLGTKLKSRIHVGSFEAMCRLIEGGVGIGIVPESAALRHRQTMQLSLIQLTDPWAIRERLVLAREFDALPGCARTLVGDLMKTRSGGARG